MNLQAALIAAVLCPLIGACALPVVGRRSPRARNWIALFLSLSACVSSCRLLPSALAGSPVALSLSFPLGFSISLYADALAVFMAVVSSFISSLVVFYSFDYISHYDNQNEYYAMVVLFLGSMMGLVYSANLLLVYLFWELTAVASWRLIGFFRAGEHITSANKAFLVTVGGAFLMLFGFILLYQRTGTFELALLKDAAVSGKLTWGIFALILAGILSKSATLPFHTWLPDAGVAPSPVTALLHAAVLVKIGVYVFARLFVVAIPVDISWMNAVCAVAAVSSLVSAGAALVDSDLKRIIAYSTVSQLGFIFLGLCAGGALAFAGALLYILMHGLAKAGLFLCAGIVEQTTHTKDIRKLGGLIRTMPMTGLAFLACAFSVMGIPPFGGFWSKYMVISGSIAAGKGMFAGIFLAGAVLTVLYLFRVFVLVFLGETKISEKEESAGMTAVVAVLALASLAGGLFAGYPGALVQKIVEGVVR